jgi:hypothetical protein
MCWRRWRMNWRRPHDPAQHPDPDGRSAERHVLSRRARRLAARPRAEGAGRTLRPLRQQPTPPPPSARRGGRASCPGACPPARGSTTTRRNSPPTSRPSPTTCAARATRPACRARCISWAPTSLHGFEERLTTDIYPADFGWTPDYRKPGERIDWWYHNMGSVTGAGVAEITNQMEYDDEVAFAAGRSSTISRGARTTRPWCLTVSFTHPHDPYVARRKFWDLYERLRASCSPTLRHSPMPDHDPHSQRIFDANDWRSPTTSPRMTSPGPAAPISPISPISTTRSRSFWTCWTAPGRRRSSSSSRTTATCWASGDCGSR